MKNLLSLILILSSVFSYAQGILPTDAQGKITFTEVVHADTLKKAILYENIKNWLAKHHYNIQTNDSDSSSIRLVTSNEFYVYAKGYISKKAHGKISYNVTIDIKDCKYRYTINNFIFHYLKENRDYKMVPTGQTKQLEDTKAQSWQSLWESHKNATNSEITEQINSLKTAAIAPPLLKKESTAEAKKTNTNNW